MDEQKYHEIFDDPANQEKIRGLKTVDEVFAFFAENGVVFDEEQKQDIRNKAQAIHEKAKETPPEELNEEELEKVAGGWDFGWAFFSGAAGAAVMFCVITACPAVVPAWAGVAALVCGAGGGFLDNVF